MARRAAAGQIELQQYHVTLHEFMLVAKLEGCCSQWVSFARRSTSSTVENFSTCMTGPKISSRAIVMSSVT